MCHLRRHALSQTRNTLQTDQHGHLILDFMRLFDMAPGESIALDVLVDYGFDQDISLNDMENALVHASTNGWISSAGDHVMLTKSGHRVAYPANDNHQTVIFPN